MAERAPATPEKPGDRDRVQTNSTPEYWIKMTGYAERIGHKIPVPRLLSVGGIPVTESERHVDDNFLIATLLGGLPYYGCHWTIYYILPEALRNKIPDLANPFFGWDGGN